MSGILIGGEFVGGVLGTIGQVALSVIDLDYLTVFSGLVGIAYGLMDFGLWRLPSLGREWQVPRHWLRDFPRELAYSLFGLFLGIGFLTAVPASAFTALLMFEVATASALTGAVLGAAYGIGRCLGLIAAQIQFAHATHPTADIPTMIGRAHYWSYILSFSLLTTSAWMLTQAFG